MRKNHINKRRKRKYHKIMASLTGAVLLSSAMFGIPSVKASETIKTQKSDALTDALTEALLKSKAEIQGKFQEKMQDEIQARAQEKVNQSIEELKNNPEIIGQAVKNSKEFLGNKIKEGLQAKVEEKKSELEQQLGDFLNQKPQDNQVINNVRATAYTSGYEDNGIWNDKTHIGTKVRPGIIAVDPKIIPLGSKVYIEFEDGSGMNAVAEDTGSAIKGNRIDIAMADSETAENFGIQNVKVRVLEKGTIV